MSAVWCGESLCLCRVTCRAVLCWLGMRSPSQLPPPPLLSPALNTRTVNTHHIMLTAVTHSYVDIRHSCPGNVHRVHCVTAELFTTKYLLSTHHDTATANYSNPNVSVHTVPTPNARKLKSHEKSKLICFAE